MLIVGAKGFAKEVLQVCHENGELENLVFYDDSSKNMESFLYGKFPILRSEADAKEYLMKVDNRFSLGVGNSKTRRDLYFKFEKIGGLAATLISAKASFGDYGVFIGDGVNIMGGTILTNSIRIERGCLVNLNCTIGHDTVIGEFSELSPGVHVSGNCTVGNQCTMGTNSTLLPGIEIEDNVTVGANAVVTENIPKNAVVVGIPGRIIKFKKTS